MAKRPLGRFSNPKINIIMAKHHQELIAFLQKNDFKADCSQCGTPFQLKDAVLFPIDEITPEAKEKMNEIKEVLKKR